MRSEGRVQIVLSGRWALSLPHPATPAATGTTATPGGRTVPAPSPPGPPFPGRGRPSLRARLLGPVEVTLDGHRLTRWHGRKGSLLLAYLLLHRDRPVPRDVLATTFWPEAAPEAARNRMHVAMHTLRADLQAASAAPVVLFDRGYTLDPALDIHLDVEAFEEAATRGRRSEARGEPAAALAAYRLAAREYRGDLLSDHPYDGWTLLLRERFRLLALDALGRAAGLAFEAHDYQQSIETAQRLLALDFCQEDVHRLLMRAHARLGRQRMALRQFDICARQLRGELDVAPARETVELYRRIRARIPV